MPFDFNQLAREYARYRKIIPFVLENLVQTAGLTHASRVLDVGCGTGNYTGALVELIGCQCWGVEPSDEMRAAAIARTPGATFLPGSAERLPFEEASFDLVFSVDVIHHVPAAQRLAYFREAYRVLRPGGKICTVTDSEAMIRQRQPLSVYFPGIVAPELQRYPSQAALREMLVGAGFIPQEEVALEEARRITDIEVYRARAFSCLHLISDAAFAEGLQRMEADLARQGWLPGLIQYLLAWGSK